MGVDCVCGVNILIGGLVIFEIGMWIIVGLLILLSVLWNFFLSERFCCKFVIFDLVIFFGCGIKEDNNDVDDDDDIIVGDNFYVEVLFMLSVIVLVIDFLFIIS